MAPTTIKGRVGVSVNPIHSSHRLSLFYRCLDSVVNCIWYIRYTGDGFTTGYPHTMAPRFILLLTSRCSSATREPLHGRIPCVVK